MSMLLPSFRLTLGLNDMSGEGIEKFRMQSSIAKSRWRKWTTVELCDVQSHSGDNYSGFEIKHWQR